jgi:hypothetical protein
MIKVSDTAKDLILNLTTTDRKARLGYGAQDAKAIKSHVFFASSDKCPSWELVENGKAPPPLDLQEINVGAARTFARKHTIIRISPPKIQHAMQSSFMPSLRQKMPVNTSLQ